MFGPVARLSNLDNIVDARRRWASLVNFLEACDVRWSATTFDGVTRGTPEDRKRVFWEARLLILTIVIILGAIAVIVAIFIGLQKTNSQHVKLKAG
jgi:hypothetical protein